MSSLGRLEDALRALGSLLKANGEEHSIVVVGGVAMNLSRVHLRATADVDVIALAAWDGPLPVLLCPDPLPEPLQRAIERVGADFGLGADWMNTMVAKQWTQGLPPDLSEDLSWFTFGGLRVGVAGRAALIALKLYATVDRGPRSVHMQDLLRLTPSEAELAEAARWVETQDVSEVFASDLKEALKYVASRTGR